MVISMTLEEAYYWHESLYGTSDPDAYQIWDQAYQVIRQHEHPEEFTEEEEE